MQCTQCRHENPAGQKFCGECGARLTLTAAAPESYTPKHLAEKILTSKSAIEGERKQVTVMFTDVSDFTGMSEALDPEDVHVVMDRAFEIILGAVHGYEGTINQFLGDGVMALFGAPIAHEDHAGRSLRAALAIQERLEPLRADVQRAHRRDFRMRIGINTGTVVVGAIGHDLRMDYTAQGDTVNLAARLVNVAQPGQIVVSRRGKDACEGYFVFDDLGEFRVKGKTEPVRGYAVVREIHGRTRLEVSRERGLTALVGRRTERDRLAQGFAEAHGGRGSVLVIAGEPGVGKSRLLYEFLRSLDGHGYLELETTCVSYGTAMAYRPIIELYRRYLDIVDTLTPEAVHARIAERLAELGLDGDEPVLLLSHFLGLPVPTDFLMRVQGTQLRDRTSALLRNMIVRESERAPVVMIVENLHWIDASSEELVKSLARMVRDHRLLLLLTTRSAAIEWLPTGDNIKLDGLDPNDLREMTRTILGAAVVSEPLFQLVLTKTEGNPLYVEEIVRQLQETSGVVVDTGEARLRTAGVTVPETIRDIIAARVDRLGDALKTTLQVASIVGRSFDVSLVSHVRDEACDDVPDHLRALHAADFVFPAGNDPEPTYSFKHALTQDVVYASLLDRRRRQVHAAVARTMEDLHAERIADVVEMLAHHYDRSGDDERAVDYAILAAEKAHRRLANTEALAVFEGALQRLASMPATEANQRRRIDAVIKQAEIKFALGRHADHVQALEYLRATVDAAADPPRRAAWAYWTGFLHSLTGARPEVSIAYCREALAIAGANGLDEIRGFAECCLTHVYSVSGDLRAGMDAGVRALAVFEARGNIFWVCRTLWGLMSVANGLGEWRESLEYCRRALAYGQEVNDHRLKVVGWWRSGSTHVQRGDAEAGLRCAEAALALTPIPIDAAMARAVKGYALIKLGQLDEGIDDLNHVLEWLARSHLGHFRWFYGYWLAEGYLRTGEPGKARAMVEDILALSRGESRRAEGIGERLLGESLAVDDPEAALAHLERASRVLREIGARNELGKTLAARAEIHRTIGDAAVATLLFRAALGIFEDLGTVDELPRVREALSTLVDQSAA